MGFVLGVVVGAALASGGFLLQRAHARHIAATRPAAAASGVPAAAPAAARAASAPATPDAAAALAPQQFDFYKMLPRFTVRVPRKPERVATVAAAPADGADRAASTADHAASYLLQVGSYRAGSEAQRVRAQLARVGIEARVERVIEGAEVWYRVRIGPISDPAELERVRSELRAAHFSALAIQQRPR
jgi:cell division protein FtsN